MGLKEEMNQRLKAAMKARDERVLDVVRMIRARAQTEAAGKGRHLGSRKARQREWSGDLALRAQAETYLMRMAWITS